MLAAAPPAEMPSFRVGGGGLIIEGVSADCPMIYDNDWWTDVPDAAYLWAKSSQGKCRLRGNIITRCTFAWEKGYVHPMRDQIDEYRKLLDLARLAGLLNIPEPVLGAEEALRKPASGRIEDTVFSRTAGSDLIVAEARKATPQKPLLVFVGGSCTTVATAYLTDASIVDRMIVFQIDGGSYNGSDAWAWEIAMKRCRFANWARGYFWDQVSTWDPKVFRELPRNPLCDWLREYAEVGHGKANQWGDGAWIYWVFDPRCLTRAEPFDNEALTVPREGTDVKRIEQEFLATMSDPATYHRASGGD